MKLTNELGSVVSDKCRARLTRAIPLAGLSYLPHADFDDVSSDAVCCVLEALSSGRYRTERALNGLVKSVVRSRLADWQRSRLAVSFESAELDELQAQERPIESDRFVTLLREIGAADTAYNPRDLQLVAVCLSQDSATILGTANELQISRREVRARICELQRLLSHHNLPSAILARLCERLRQIVSDDDARNAIESVRTCSGH